jgi:uncharacterized BrkB/YihY/UPF0761 family membrane protein
MGTYAGHITQSNHEGGSAMVRPKALAAAREWYADSLAQRFLAQLKALDFANQAMMFGGGLLVSLLPFMILLSSFASQRVQDDITVRLGLDPHAADIVDRLFTHPPATLNTATGTSLVFLLAGRVAWRTLLPSAVITGLCYGGLGLFSKFYFSGTIISDSQTYGTIGAILSIMTWFIAIGAVIILGAVAGAVWEGRHR